MQDQMKARLEKMQLVASEGSLGATVALAEIVQFEGKFHILGAWAGDSGIYTYKLNDSSSLTKITLDDDLLAYLSLPPEEEERLKRKRYVAEMISPENIDALSVVLNKVSDGGAADVATVTQRLRELQKVFANVDRSEDFLLEYRPQKNVFLSLPFFQSGSNDENYVAKLAKGLHFIFENRNLITNSVSRRLTDSEKAYPFVPHTINQEIQGG